MNATLETPPCARCGHSALSHYNTRNVRRAHSGHDVKNAPCHHRGKHDTRCGCRDYVAPTETFECCGGSDEHPPQHTQDCAEQGAPGRP